MRSRPNKSIQIRAPNKLPNSIYRKYRSIWQVLLNQQSLGIQHSRYDKYYVEMPGIHNELFDAVSSSRDSIRCLLGYTGIGKSTIIRRVFMMNSDRPVIRTK